ncbi:50S ribosomal protein L24 [Buchnera aphidicola]|uniref:Large ribosomal subunit protein uL24 n=1 Tax=Buchnera aphidicola subsp. Tuberolachnus salignus TaxID=98804 RepID=A0A160SX14_BUCTT|nr:50S ribosomal protein L24 [Buchnera aphidicola]CUR53310.1 50S ribosomal protein L24 [Buchnera aphidicola (Tuberolachnus salignus)]
MAYKIHVKDFVIIIAGKNKGKTGYVTYINYKKNNAIIEGLNIVFKHQKSIPERNQIGGIIKKEAPIHLSNLALFNQETKKSDKVFFKVVDGKKRRYFKSTKTLIS